VHTPVTSDFLTVSRKIKGCKNRKILIDEWEEILKKPVFPISCKRQHPANPELAQWHHLSKKTRNFPKPSAFS